MRYDACMTKNPFYNAILAAGYITLVANIMNYAEKSDLPEIGVLVPDCHTLTLRALGSYDGIHFLLSSCAHVP